MKALLWNGAIKACPTHGKECTHHKPVKPKTRCVVCWLVYLADQLECSLYQDDIAALLKFAKITTKIEFEETTCDT